MRCSVSYKVGRLLEIWMIILGKIKFMHLHVLCQYILFIIIDKQPNSHLSTYRFKPARVGSHFTTWALIM